MGGDQQALKPAVQVAASYAHDAAADKFKTETGILSTNGT